MEIMGIDIGGSGIKGAPVDLDRGELASDRCRIPTPHPAKPEAVTDVVAQIIQSFQWNGPIGCTFPAIMKDGIAYSAANVDDDWIGTDAQRLIQRKTGDPVKVINDADAAGLAEMRYGAGRGKMGVVIVLTIGTGIGSAIFIDGHLVPNTELGHLEIRGKEGEHRASDKVREDKNLSWKKWAKRLNEYFQHVEFLFSPDLFIVGGGVSKKYDKYFPYLDLRTEIVPAQLRNEAGIIGAALAAEELI
ncbi:ROK family protein [Phototrophicus methaneseepsis]|uniref:ROK family protein n=1 Tax=Phototrophicus methaneseepsis TaxID=2710758 RepID=A0A7S8E6G6_9CHLR|nr:ROK family protein [Phototrophicus methaneseepsis]QPC81169.1 ROK family protein [Phototrophicus methaneseepsis]